MNVLLIADGDIKYGASHSLFQMAKELSSFYEINIQIVMPVTAGFKGELDTGIKVLYIRYSPFYQGIPADRWKFPIKYIVRGIMYWFGRICAVNELEKQLDIHKIDLIHSNSSREDLGALIANKYKIPLIWHIREFGDRDYSCYSYRKNYIDYMNQSACRFIAVSDAVRAHWIKKGIQREKINCVYNGISQRDIVIKSEDALICNNKQLRMALLGCISSTKGQAWAIEAIKKLADEKIYISLDIIGDGAKAYIKKLKKKIYGYGLQDLIAFKGYLKNPGEQLYQYDIGLMCSKDEGFGRVTVEYMMAGLCVIASDTGANKELIEDGESGLIYQYGNTESLVNTIKKCIDNPEDRCRIAKCGCIRANQEFTAERNAKRICEIYKSILEHVEK